MKAEHEALLEMSDHLPKPEDFESRIVEFLTTGMALGQKLSLPAERHEAQGLLDYWISSLPSTLLSQEFGSKKAILDSFTMIRRQFVSQRRLRYSSMKCRRMIKN